MTAAVAFNALERTQPALGRSFVLSLLVHLALGVVIFLGVRWQVSAPDTVTVELVDELPPPPAPVVEAPKPPPKVEPPPVVKPAPRVEKPQIVIPEKAKPKPKPEAKPKPETKPKADPDFQKRFREQMAQEQKALDQQRAERDLRELIARQAATARAKALNEYIARIQGSIRQRILGAALEGISGNPAAEFDVVQLPTGEVISIHMRKSSGYPRYDEGVERAIRAASPLPLPAQRELFSRELKLTFRPLDK